MPLETLFGLANSKIANKIAGKFKLPVHILHPEELATLFFNLHKNKYHPV